MSNLEYYSLSRPKRFFYKLSSFFVNIPLGIGRFFKKLPNKLVNFFKKFFHPLANIWSWFVKGDFLTRLSFIVMGSGQIARHQIIRGVLNLLYEIVAITFIILVGVPSFTKLPSFGYISSIQYETNTPPFVGYMYQDDSFKILLYSVVSLIVILILAFLWYTNIRDAYELQRMKEIGRKTSDLETVKGLVGKDYHKVMLSIPTLGIAIFTVIPLIFMILVAFTNFNSNHMNPKELFDWVGLGNFSQLLGLTGTNNGNQFAMVFLQILIWTLIWAFFATFTNYFLGMIVAIMINKKGIKLKKMWRTILITTIAVPQFVSLLLMSKMLNTDTGVVNAILKNAGLITENIRFLTNGLLVKVTIILVNMWIGIPYTMLMCTGILMNIPDDLYESAKIDGASPYKMYMKITLPYMLFVTTPYLISQFVGNINNFNVIYLLSSGGPIFSSVNGEIITAQVFGAGQSDLLITWLYKMSMGEVFKDYGAASVIGIVVFVIVAFFSLIFYGRSNSVKNEEDFQ